MSKVSQRQTVVLGFDFGLKRIGVAVGQSISKTANPLKVLIAHAGVPEWNEIACLIDLWQADVLVVGVPYQLDCSEQAMTSAAREFVVKLKERFHLPVYEADERFTSIDARQQLLEERRLVVKKSEKGRSLVDHYAAKLILEDWLRQH